MPHEVSRLELLLHHSLVTQWLSLPMAAVMHCICLVAVYLFWNVLPAWMPGCYSCLDHRTKPRNLLVLLFWCMLIECACRILMTSVRSSVMMSWGGWQAKTSFWLLVDRSISGIIYSSDLTQFGYRVTPSVPFLDLCALSSHKLHPESVILNQWYSNGASDTNDHATFANSRTIVVCRNVCMVVASEHEHYGQCQGLRQDDFSDV